MEPERKKEQNFTEQPSGRKTVPKGLSWSKAWVELWFRADTGLVSGKNR